MAPGGIFDVPSELEALRRCSLLVWQFPLYWYSAPAILRQWQDQVLSAAVYGADAAVIAARCGTALVIARKDASRVGMLQELVGSFSGSPAKLAGVVMNEF